MIIQVDKVLPNPEQPRKVFDQAELESLAESIKEIGLRNPITVEGPYEDGSYILEDGERRLRAHKLAGIGSIEAITREPNGHDPHMRLKAALVANMQRSDLDPIEEGLAYLRLREAKMTYNAIARLVGRTAANVQLKVKMLDLQDEVKGLYRQKLLPIDTEIIYNLAKTPARQQVRLARKFAQNNTSTMRIRTILDRVLTLQQTHEDVPLQKKRGRSPSVELSKLDTKIFVLLEKAGVELTQWELLNQAAEMTCQECDLADVASTAVCSDCPAVDLLKNLGKLAEKEGK